MNLPTSSKVYCSYLCILAANIASLRSAAFDLANDLFCHVVLVPYFSDLLGVFCECLEFCPGSSVAFSGCSHTWPFYVCIHFHLGNPRVKRQVNPCLKDDLWMNRSKPNLTVVEDSSDIMYCSSLLRRESRCAFCVQADMNKLDLCSRQNEWTGMYVPRQCEMTGIYGQVNVKGQDLCSRQCERTGICCHVNANGLDLCSRQCEWTGICVRVSVNGHGFVFALVWKDRDLCSHQCEWTEIYVHVFTSAWTDSDCLSSLWTDGRLCDSDWVLTFVHVSVNMDPDVCSRECDAMDRALSSCQNERTMLP